MTGRFLPGVPGPQVEAAYREAPGNEIETGKFDHPESSARLAANAFGFFLDRPEDLPRFRDASAKSGRRRPWLSNRPCASRGGEDAIRSWTFS